MSDLDTLARAATRELLDHGVPDVGARYAELKRIRARRTTAKVAAAAVAVVLGISGWQLGGPGERRAPEPVSPRQEMHNGAVLGIHDFGGGEPAHWGTAYGDLNPHLPVDPGAQPLLQFSADGRTFFYSDDRQRLASWDLATGTKTVLAPCPEGGCTNGSVSPDASTAVFAADDHLVLVDLATGAARSEALPVQGGVPAWSPDGQHLAIMSASGLWTVGVDRSDPTLVHPAGAVGSMPASSVAWSPDGSRIAFVDVSEVAGGDASGQYTLMTVHADGTQPVEVHGVGCCAADATSTPSVAWSPDGTELAVATSDLGAATGVYTVGLDGSDWTLRMKGEWTRLTWQPVG